MVDADIGLRNLDVVMGLENRIVYDLVDVVEGHCKLRNALIKDKRVEDLFLLPSRPNPGEGCGHAAADERDLRDLERGV